MNQISYTIEALVKYNTKVIKYFGDKNNFTCFVKLISLKGYEETIEVEAFQMPVLETKFAAKLTFKFNPFEFINYDNDLDLNRILTAIIWKPDYNKDINLNNITEIISNKNDARLYLPYSLLKWQIPEIIQTNNPRIPSVGLCIHYTYEMPSFILNWIDYQLSLGFHQIRFYDSTEGSVLTKKIHDFYGDKNEQLVIQPYYEPSCDEKILFKNLNEVGIPIEVKKRLVSSCEELSKNEFSKKHYYRDNHEGLTVNDCYSVYRQKYEFIAHFDLDEVIFSRNFNDSDYFTQTNKEIKCSDSKTFCKLKPFKNDFESNKLNEQNSIYNYVQFLINKFRNDRDPNKLSSIYFQNAVYLPPDIEEKKLIDEFDSIISTDNAKRTYPIKVYLSTPPYNQGHTFLIETDENIQYIKYLSNFYRNYLKSCIFNEHLNKSDKIHRNFLRYLYFVSEPNEREPKAIHYYKNVNTILIHRGVDFVKGHWLMHPDIFTGHYLAHFRESNHFLYNANATGSIRKLNIDYEYLFFMLNKFSNYCLQFE
jgi:hypothetical protein